MLAMGTGSDGHSGGPGTAAATSPEQDAQAPLAPAPGAPLVASEEAGLLWHKEAAGVVIKGAA